MWRASWLEDPHGHRQPAAVREGGRGVAPAARAARGADGAHRPALRRRALEGVLRGAGRARAGPPAERRRRHEHRADGRILGLLEGELAEARPDLVLVYGDTNSTLAGALAAAQAHVPVGHVEAGMRSFDRAMPEELNRVLTDHASDLLLCSTETAMANLERESAAGEAHLVGDVMADVSLTFRPVAEERSTALADNGLEPGGYLLATAHRAGNVDDPERLAALVSRVRGAARHDGPPAASPHGGAPGRRGPARTAGDGGDAAPAARLPRLHEAGDARPGGAHRLRRRAEGGLPAGGAVRDAARHHRVGRDGGGGLEHARGSQPGRAVAALERPAPEGERPELYGGGRAAERIRDVLAAYTPRP